MTVPGERLPERATAGGVVDFLAGHRVFRVLPKPLLTAFAAQVAERSYAKGHYLSYAGDPLIYVFVVKAGLVAMTRLDEHGNLHAARTLFPGDLAGLAVAVSDQRWRLSAVAVVDSEALLVHKDSIEDLYRRCPAFAQRVTTELGEVSRRSQEETIRLSQSSVASRVAAFLLQSATKDADPPLGFLGCELALSQQDLALLLGSTRETVNRILVRFCQSGLIAIDGRRVLILRADALRRLADG